MLNKEKHKLIMGRILRDIYTDVTIAPLLGFKGGTCAYLFYELPRFSVDLDFDLFVTDEATQKQIFEKVKTILEQYGTTKDRYIKRNTIFFALSYGDEDHNIKFEVNIRVFVSNMKARYELKEYLGISMMAAKKPYLFAGKLSALTLRDRMAMRDIYDIWFFANKNWGIDAEVVKVLTGKEVKEQMAECVALIEKVKDSEILSGLSELLENEKQKVWVKTHLRKEAIFELKNFIEAFS